MIRVCLRESRYIGHTNAEDIWYTLHIFSGLLTHNKSYYCLDRLSKVILPYKDDAIFISLFIVYVVAVYHAMVYPLALYIYGTFLRKQNTYRHIPSSKSLDIEIETDQTNRMGWKDRAAAGMTLQSWPGRPDELDTWDCFIGSDRTDGL